MRPETPLDEVAATLEARDISCVVVTDEGSMPAGIVSTTDLLRDALDQLAAPHVTGAAAPAPRRARDVMRTALIGVDEIAPVRVAAQMMLDHRIHRVLVFRSGRAVGVLSTRDVMRAVMFHHVDVPLSEVMTIPVETVDVGEGIGAALGRLGTRAVRGLAGVDGSYPVGLFTETEALKARSLPHEVLNNPVEQVMSYQMLCLDVRTPLYRVAGQAIATRARRIFAVKGRDLVGIATGFDLTRVATMDLA